ncbi:MAG: hypothetical protein HW380_1070 [Magnetococcales bacterium]|nr:hypothetical protein [Magnetococcales bacterium]
MNSNKTFDQEHLEPHVRLFLSVDMIGSTAYKQRWISAEVNESWILFFESFFDAFNNKFHSEIDKIFNVPGVTKTEFPGPWKLLGDEILYAIKLNKGWEVSHYVNAFREAVISHRNEIEKSGKPVSLKATAWLAGFPVGNSVIVTPAGGIDFIGPLIDIGFRLSKFASRERMILSVDLVWYLTKGPSALNHLFLDSLKSLDGVLGGKPYPIIWYSMDIQLSSGMRDVGLISTVDAAKLHTYCDLFISRAPKPLIHPFFTEDGDPMPDNYSTDLERVRQLRNNIPDGHPEETYDKSVDVMTNEDYKIINKTKSSIESNIALLNKPSGISESVDTSI